MALTFTERKSKLQQLTELLADPELAGVARWLLGDQTSIAHPDIKRENVLIAKRYAVPRKKKNRGDLTRAILATVSESIRPVSAKDVASAMEAKGFSFDAVDKQVAVSKVLRKLKDQQKISGNKTVANGKSAFVYFVPQMSLSGEVRH